MPTPSQGAEQELELHTYYTSEIGIKQELEYRGNTVQAEFSEIDVSKEP